VSEQPPFPPGAGASSPQDAAAEEEVLDGIPVLAEEPWTPSVTPPRGDLERRGSAMVPAVQAAAVAAGSFVAGAAVVGLVHRRHRRAATLAKGRRGAGRPVRGGSSRRGSRAGELVQIVGSRSLLVDVHLLGGSDGDR
jgi:hypothetical protein